MWPGCGICWVSDPQAARPRVAVHASISLDGSMTGFMPDLAAHYAAAATVPAQARLIGSRTMTTGLDMFGDPHAQPAGDDVPRADDPSLPYWVVVDGAGALQGRLHEVRRYPGVREVLVLVTARTPEAYLRYLAEHHYPTHTSGQEHVDLVAALAWLRRERSVSQVLVDSGPTLTSVLLGQGLVDEVHVLIHPVVVGVNGRRLFGETAEPAHLRLVAQEAGTGGIVHLHYGRAADAA
jgi:2,5-diamino-6-(ribosylamino)-4(3H)-pyrimidinone 5'-phosphate reductase